MKRTNKPITLLAAAAFVGLGLTGVWACYTDGGKELCVRAGTLVDHFAGKCATHEDELRIQDNVWVPNTQWVNSGGQIDRKPLPEWAPVLNVELIAYDEFCVARTTLNYSHIYDWLCTKHVADGATCVNLGP